MTHQPLDRYLAIIHWLRKRYTQPDGYLVLDIGGVPSRFNLLELAFARRYLECAA